MEPVWKYLCLDAVLEATVACNKILIFQDLAFLRQLSRNKIPGDTPGIYLIIIYFRELKNISRKNGAAQVKDAKFSDPYI